MATSEEVRREAAIAATASLNGVRQRRARNRVDFVAAPATSARACIVVSRSLSIQILTRRLHVFVALEIVAAVADRVCAQIVLDSNA